MLGLALTRPNMYAKFEVHSFTCCEDMTTAPKFNKKAVRCHTRNHRVMQGQVSLYTRKLHKGGDSHRHQHARLAAAYVQSQSQASSLGQHGDKTSEFW